MKSRDARLDRLEQGLAEAHRAQQPPELSVAWSYAVMREVRQRVTRSSAVEVPKVMWRAATVVAFVSMIVVGSLMAWNADRTGTGFAGLFTETPVDIGVL